MKSLAKRYIILWVLVLLIFNSVVLLIQYMVPSLDLYRGAAIETAKNLITSTASIPDDTRKEAIKGLLSFQSTIFGIVAFNILMFIQLIYFIIITSKTKNKDDLLLFLPLLALSRKFLIMTVIICLIFSLVKGIPTFVAIVISLVYIIYIFVQYNKFFMQKEYVEDLEKRNNERKSK